MSSWSTPNFKRAFPANFAASVSFPAEKKIASPSPIPVRPLSISNTSLDILEAIGPLPSPSARIIYPIPGAPSLWAQEFMRSQIALLPHFGPGNARTTPPSATVFAKIANSLFSKRSETSQISMGIRKSGLSVPYFNIASENGILGKG